MELNEVGKLGLALALGLLVGLQRERTAPHVAGIRTMGLVTLLGALLGLLADPFGTWLPVAGLVVVGASLLTLHAVRFSRGAQDAGLTTLVASLLLFAVGLAIARGREQVGILVAGGVAVLLHWKVPLHRFVERIDEADVRAIFRLVLIGLVVLPLLPNRDFGPYEVLNPFEIWLMVVLICGISVASYLVHGLVGARAGTILGGILGGLISSTATTVSHARRARQDPGTSVGSALVILIASTAVIARVALEVGIVAPRLLPELLPPLLVVVAVMAATSVLGTLRWRTGEQTMADLPDDRMGLTSALVFGLMYGLVLLAVAYTRQHLGDESLYAVAAVSGLTDVDAITLSTAQMIAKGTLSTHTAWRMILAAFLANLVFKAVIVAFLGNLRTFGTVSAVFGAALVAGGLVLWLWP